MEAEFNMEGTGLVHVKGNKRTGKFSIQVDGKPMNRIGKNVFSLGQGSDKLVLSISGNLLKGYSIPHGKLIYPLSSPVPWYCYIIPSASFAMAMVLGNIPYLAQHGFYFVGGAIGGAIAGLCSMLSLSFAALVSKWWVRLLICLGGLLLTFGLCFAVGNLIVWGMTR